MSVEHVASASHSHSPRSGSRDTRSGFSSARSTVLSFAVLLSACGGGGGDSVPAVGAGPTTNTTAFRVTLDRSSVAFTYVAGIPATPAEMLTATGTGTPPSQLYVGAIAEGPAIDPVVPVSLNGMTAQATLRPKTGLTPGDYAGRVLFLVCTDVNCAQQVAGSPLTIAYSVKVLPTLETASPVILVGAETDPAKPLTGSVRIDSPAGSPAFDWTATSADSWLRVIRAAGASGTNVEYEVDWTHVKAMPNDFEQVGQIRLTTTRPNESSPVVAVKVRKALPALESGTPQVLVAMRTTRVVLRGRNFDGLVQLADRVQVTGGTLVAAAKINDKALLVDIAPNLLGDMTIRVLNAQGVTTQDTRVQVVPPREYDYAIAGGPGLRRSAVLDPSTHAVFSANTESQIIEKYQFDGASWPLTTRQVVLLSDIGLTRNGRSIVATTRAPIWRLVRYRSDTLDYEAETQSLTGFGGGSERIGNGIPVTNDERMWLANGGGTRNGVSYYDVSANKIVDVILPTNGAFPLSGGPWYSVAANGERLITVFGADTSPLPDLHYLDASEGVMKRAAPGLTFYRTSSSDAGDRVLYETTAVRDANFQLVGTFNIQPDELSYIPVGGAVSRDGRRTYLLASGPTTRIYVFDTTTPSPSTPLSPIGMFDVPDAPSCAPGPFCVAPYVIVKMAADGNTLFLVGNERVIVQPIPAQFRSVGRPLQGILLQAHPQAKAVPLAKN